MIERIIPVFLLKGKRLVKGTQFKDYVDVGDPISQAMVYDAQGADEIIIVDIEASNQGRIIDTKIITEMIIKCRLPIGVGGGIKNIEDARKCFDAGADKVVVNTHAVRSPLLIKELAGEFGSQSIIVSLDVRRNAKGNYDIYTFGGSEKAGAELSYFLSEIIKYEPGEIMLTSIGREGTLSGFDYDLYNNVRSLIPVPLIASGGAGCYDDMVRLFKETDCDACGIGKMLFLRDYDMVRIKSYLKGREVLVREA